MNSAKRSQVQDLYNTDLERYLFAPAPRPTDRGRRRWPLRPTTDRLSRWLQGRRQALASFASVFAAL